MRKHLAIFSKDIIEQIFSGKKNIDVRLSQKRIAPFGQIAVGDIVYIKPPGEEILGQFIAKKVIFLEGLSGEDWKILQKGYGIKESFKMRQRKGRFQEIHPPKFATLIFMDQVEQFITSPVKIKKSDLRGWVVL